MVTMARLTNQKLVMVIFAVFVSLSVLYVMEAKKASARRSNPKTIQACKAMTWFDKRQRRSCIRNPGMIGKVKDGVEDALAECRRQFKSFRWNCSPLTWMQVFEEGGILKKRSRETAFVQALSAAGVMQKVAKACAKGHLQSCDCGTVRTKKKRNNRKWIWGGCGDNLGYGSSFTKHFMDPKKITNHARKTKVHNHEVGRRIVRDNYVRKCKCHGNSESCTVRICWRVAPTMETIGNTLWKRYQNSVKTRWDPKANNLLDRRRSKRNKKVTLTPNQLSFFANSENFCRQNIPMGIMGTVGRVCNSTSSGSDGCATMCCGRSFKTRVVTVTKKCNCKFVWCCSIKCDTCTWTEKVETCQ